MKVQKALISVSDKTGILDFTKFLVEQGISIIATGGTYKYLKGNGIPTKEVSEYINFPEILGGRVKTLHPKIFGGILANRDNERHKEELEKNGISFIDLIVVNLYPFEKGLKENMSPNEMIELIDIGGVSLIRAGAKNYRDCVVLTSPEQYKEFQEGFKKNNGNITLPQRIKYARKAFLKTRDYDNLISGFFSEKLREGEEKEFPEIFSINLKKISTLRYGENSHQRSAFYIEKGAENSIGNAIQLNGKQLSYNNIMDADAALGIVQEFDIPAASVVKHAAPCGVGIGDNITNAFKKAHISDPISAFGGIIALNRKVKIETAQEITASFFEVVIAPDYEEDALNELKRKKNLRILEIKEMGKRNRYFDYKRVYGGLLVQDADIDIDTPEGWKISSNREPTEREWEAAKFAWKVVKWVKSNGIVISINDRTLGIGTGQPSRVDSVEIAVKKAHNQGHFTGATALASDGFFPFRDSIDRASEGGVSVVIEPGGSIRDKEVIQAANEYNIALIFTGKRHFRH